MTARRPNSVSSFRLTFDKMDKLEVGTPASADLLPFFSVTDGFAKGMYPGTTNSVAPTIATTTTVLASTDSGKTYTNEGASAQVEFDLPTAVAGLRFSFIVQDSDGIKVVANTGDTIRNDSGVSASAGYIESTTVGSTITLVAINDTEWIVTVQRGTWDIDV